MSPKSAKLSPAMQHVLDRMDEGWTLHENVLNTVIEGRAWLESPQTGIGHEPVNLNTLNALCQRGLLAEHPSWPTYTYSRAAATGPGDARD